MTLTVGEKYLHMGIPVTLLHVRKAGLSVILTEEEHVYSIQTDGLLPLPRTLELWINIYEDEEFVAHRTLAGANGGRCEDRLACKKVVVEY